MPERLHILRNRKMRLLGKERTLARNLRGRKQFGWRKLDDRNPLDFDFEYFMTYHINGMRSNDRLWCDGAIVERVSRRGPNKYFLEGKLWLLPEDESTEKYSIAKWRDDFEFGGFVQLHPKNDAIRNYDFVIVGCDMRIHCHRKI